MFDYGPRPGQFLDPREPLVQAIAGFADRAMVVDPDGTIRALTRE